MRSREEQMRTISIKTSFSDCAKLHSSADFINKLNIIVCKVGFNTPLAITEIEASTVMDMIITYPY